MKLPGTNVPPQRSTNHHRPQGAQLQTNGGGQSRGDLGNEVQDKQI